MSEIDTVLTDAIVVWSGHGTTASPLREPETVVREFGSALGARLVARIDELEEEFYRSSAHREVADLNQMGDRAGAEFQAAHPEIGDRAVQAFVWCYTFDYR